MPAEKLRDQRDASFYFLVTFLVFGIVFAGVIYTNDANDSNREWSEYLTRIKLSANRKNLESKILEMFENQEDQSKIKEENQAINDNLVKNTKSIQSVDETRRSFMDINSQIDKLMKQTMSVTKQKAATKIEERVVTEAGRIKQAEYAKQFNILKNDEILDYHNINHYFYEYLQQKKPEIEREIKDHDPYVYQAYKNLFENITPWPILNSNPTTTILPYVHVPKTAGSTFRGFLGHWDKYEWPYRSAMYPRWGTKSYNSPGCRSGADWGGTHCGYAELDDCIRNDFANLYDNQAVKWQYFKTFPRPTPRPGYLNDTLISHYSNIKYLSIIRNPVVRVVSEYYWWKPADASIQRGKACGVPSWSPNLCWNSKTLEEWTKSDYNHGHNRQVKSYYPAKRNKVLYPEGMESGYRNHCANLNGRRDYVYVTQNYPGSNSTATLNKNYQILIDTIENINKNFNFIAVFEEMTMSTDIAKITLNYRDPKDIFFNRKRRGVSHSTESKRPAEYPVRILKEIFERNRLDMLLWDYLYRKYIVSYEYYKEIARRELYGSEDSS